jgi:hypothetical protein
MVAVVRDDVRVVELVRRVVAWTRGELGGAVDHVLDVLRGDLRPALDRPDHVELGAERLHQLEALLREAVRDDDQCAVALCTAHERERGARAAARVLHDRVAGRDERVPLGALDHRERHPVLHRAAGVAVLELQPKLCAVRRSAPVHADDRRVPDCVEDRLHAGMISQ